MQTNLFWFIETKEPDLWDIVDPWRWNLTHGRSYQFQMLALWDSYAHRYMTIAESYDQRRLIGYNYYNNWDNFTVYVSNPISTPQRWP